MPNDDGRLGGFCFSPSIGAGIRPDHDEKEIRKARDGFINHFAVQVARAQAESSLMVSPQDPYPRKRKAFRDQGEEVAKPVRPGRHDRLWNFARISTQIEQLYAIDPAKGAALFLKAKKAFFKERWTLNHFQSPDSRELLIQLNLLFRGRSKAPPMEPVECGTSLRPLSLDGRYAVPSASHAHQRKSRAKEISWHKDPRIIIIFGVLAFLFVFLVALFLGPVSSTEIIPVQPFQP